MSVFISWAGADRDVKNVITGRLREENIEYWESDEFCVSDFSKECISAIKRSNVFIVIISNASMDEHSYVISEVLTARQMENDGKLNILVYKVCEEPYTERFEMQLNHISDANHVARVQNAGLTGGIDSLLTRVKYLLKKRRDGAPEKPYDVLLPRVAGVQIGGSGFFVQSSRDDVLEKIKDGFAVSNVIVLSELFGFGKKSVIRKFAEECGREFSSAVEAEAMHESLYNYFANGLSFTNINEAAFDACSEKERIIKKIEFLKKLDEKHLLVISDVDLGDAVDDFICSHLNGVQCKIVFITQDSAHAYRDIYPVISVGRMENTYLSELFFHHYTRANAAQKEALEAPLYAFFDAIGGHTKTVEVTASVLSRELLAAPDKLATYLAVDGDASALLHDRIVQKLSDVIALENFDADETATLLLAVLTAAPTVEEKMLLQLMEQCGAGTPESIIKLDNRRWISYNPQSGSVYVEPIIAHICVKKLLTDDALPLVCLDYFDGVFNKVLFSSGLFLHTLLHQAEHFFGLMQQEEIVEICRALRMVAQASGESEIESSYLKGICARFEATVPEFDEEDPFEGSCSFDAAAKLWAAERLLPILKVNANCFMGSVLNFSKKNSASPSEIQAAFSNANFSLDSEEVQELYKEIEDVLATFNGLENAFADEEDECYAIGVLCMACLDDFTKGNYAGMMNKVDMLLENLYANPLILEDEEIRMLAVNCLRIAWAGYDNAQLHRSASMFFEKVLAVEWPVGEKYSFLMLYITSLSKIEDASENMLFALEMAAEIFDEAMAITSVSASEVLNQKKLLLFRYAVAHCIVGDVASAVEKFAQAQALDAFSMVEDALYCANFILKKLIYGGDRVGAIELISQHRGLFDIFLYSENADCKQIAQEAIAMAEVFGASGEINLAPGGVTENKSYYQKYSAGMGNNPFAMMKYNRIADGAKRFDFSAFSDAEIAEHSQKLRLRAQKENRMKLAPEAFALVSEAGMRVLGYKHHHVQYVGAAVMLEGKIAEILNGEGKTYTIPLVAYMCWLGGEQVLIVDDSKYLTARNFRWMRGLYEMLGLHAEMLQSPQADTALMAVPQADVTYADLATLGIAVIRNEIQIKAPCADLSCFSVIIDEADNILIDKALTDIQIVQQMPPSNRKYELCGKAYLLAKRVANDEKYYSCKGAVVFTSEMYPLLEEVFGINYEDVEQADLIIEAETLVKRAIHRFGHSVLDQDYFIRGNKVYFEYTQNGTLYEADPVDGYFLAKKHGLPEYTYYNSLCENKKVLNGTFVYGLLQKFGFVCGTSATVSSFKKEFKEVYDMEVVAIPPARPVVREDKAVSLFMKQEYKNEAILDMIAEKHAMHQPVLLITGSIRDSEWFSEELTACGIAHKLLNATNSEKSPEILAEAGMPDAVLVTTTMANRGVDIKLGGDAERAACTELVEMGIDVTNLSDLMYRRPSESDKQTELYRCYTAALEKWRAITAHAKAQVLEAGGLCVICSEPFEDMRIEQQARGRSGRQGELGESYVFECISDSMFRTIFTEKMLKVYEDLGEETEIMDSRMLSVAIERAKKSLHHQRYKRMRNAAEAAMQIEQSKGIILSIKHDILTDLCSMDNILDMWAKLQENTDAALAMLRGERNERQNYYIYKLLKEHSDLFVGANERNICAKLCEAAKQNIAENGLTQKDFLVLLLEFLPKVWPEHLEMILADLKMQGESKKIKMSKEFYNERYDKDLSERLAMTVQKIIFAKKLPESGEGKAPKYEVETYKLKS